jgi:ubiquinone/menaquinone biosynthesis C-methylase UbiE
MSKHSIMSIIARSEQMTSKNKVKQFWIHSTKDYFSDMKTGIDISRQQDNYWKYLDLWEKHVALDNLTDGLVLDLGAGTGRITKFLRAYGKKVISTDFVYECLTAIDRIGNERHCSNMDVMALALQDASVDSVVSCRVLQSLPTKKEKEIALKEIHRILKKGGRLILIEGNPIRVKIVPVPYNFYIPLSEWKELLTMHGFTIEKVYGIPFLTATKVLEKITFGASAHSDLLYKCVSFLDSHLKQSCLKHLSLQFDIIAKKN